MNYTITNNTLTITDTPNFTGLNIEGATFYTGGRNQPGQEQGYIEPGIEINTGTPGSAVELTIPDGIDLAELERAMDGAMVRTGDMSEADFEAKYPPELIGE